MEDIIQLKDQFYVLATSALADQRTRVLKDGEGFAVFDVYGNIQPIGMGVQGVYVGATRFLSRLELSISNVRPLLLSSTVKNDNTLLTVDMMNRDSTVPHAPAPGTIHIFRSKFMRDLVCHERVRLSNFGDKAVDLEIAYRFQCDFADIFEIRGIARSKRGEMLPVERLDNGLLIGYRGLDGMVRRTRFEVSPRPFAINENEIVFRTRIPARGKAAFFFSMGCEEDKPKSERLVSYRSAYAKMNLAVSAEKQSDPVITTSNNQFDDWMQRSFADLHMMVTKTPSGPYPYAGVPLFNTVFGRDGLITAIQTMWINPGIAKGVLAYLAKSQATQDNPEQDAEPGKILHEVRTGEMVALGEVPFRRYYGSADSTPLFIVLAGKYFDRTGDRVFLESIRENLILALDWIDKYGDCDGDGFVEYRRRSPRGLQNQGWKDSHDSIFHADGRMAEGPIALCEIQAYCYEAKVRAADLLEAMGDTQRPARLRREAEELRMRFEEKFWCDELSTYAIALDGDKNPCRVRSSNAGHCLYSGIASQDRAWRTAFTLMGAKMFSGWGVRTIAVGEARYNPMSYHNGSIWPHDNSFIAQGLCRYGFKSLAGKLFTGLFDAALAIDMHRLPELFCGFVRRPGEGPTLYPVACSPQSWASASSFYLLKSLLGLSVRANPASLRFFYPELPEWLQTVEIRNLAVGEATVDLRIERHRLNVGIDVLRKTGDCEIILIK